MTALPALSLLQLQPDLLQLRRWLQQTGQPRLADDLGYALHACAKAALGSLAPKPFVLQQRGADTQLLGYVPAEAAALQRAASLCLADPLAAEALGLAHLQLRELPSDWRAGETLRFSLRAVPMVRSRSQPDGGLHEVDAARHPLYADSPEVTREVAYQRWLARELAREGAAELQGCELRGYAMLQGVRRHARAPGQGRKTQGAWLPDAKFAGRLVVRSPAAFHALLARGVGRHRAFGYGCLLLAPG